ncbi:hypothetical protein CAEBREN_06873 [Caenorhabditis brenneri]|uniref:LSM domain-containing protein n=1 Tax=Caenorhabditis brenneri TaxID=135651 RepID=G0P8N9_CAEBE|nr:hypothetical protein CAEBREN_06873 [Caenorhabditis brenneri]
MSEAKEKQRLESGCGAVLQGMSGKKVCVELRGENYVIGEDSDYLLKVFDNLLGTLISCDSELNLKLTDVTVIRDAQKTEEPEYHVIGRHIRFVHFQNHVNAPAAIRRCINGVQAGKPKQNRRLDQKQFDTGRKFIDRGNY